MIAILLVFFITVAVACAPRPRPRAQRKENNILSQVFATNSTNLFVECFSSLYFVCM